MGTTYVCEHQSSGVFLDTRRRICFLSVVEVITCPAAVHALSAVSSAIVSSVDSTTSLTATQDGNFCWMAGLRFLLPHGLPFLNARNSQYETE